MFQVTTARIESVLRTFWIGGMWVTGYVMVPILFASLESRQLAGELAGHMFEAINYIGLGCGVVLLIFAWLHVGKMQRARLHIGALVLMLLLIIVSAFVLQPMMVSLKLEGLLPGSEAAAQFGQLHGVSAVLYLLTSLLGLLLLLLPRHPLRD